MGRPPHSEETAGTADPSDLAHAKTALSDAQDERARLRASLEDALSNGDEEAIEQAQQAIRRHQGGHERLKAQVLKLRIQALATRKSVLLSALENIEIDMAQSQRQLELVS
jgi:hypothetical protein